MEVYQLPDALPMTEQYLAVKTLTKHFGEASDITLSFKNDLFEEKVELIKKQRVEFRSIVIETIRHSKNLVEFGEDLIEFFDGYESNEDKLAHLNSLLSDARVNKASIEKTKSKIKKLLDGMLNFIDGLVKDFKDDKKVDPSTYNNLAKLVILVIGVAAFVVTKIVTSLNAKNKSLEATILKNTIDERKNQITEKSGELKKSFYDSMHPCLKKLESFWDKYVDKLERLIEKYKSPSEHGSPRIKFMINKKRWMESIEECKNYSRDINNGINTDIFKLE
ncbi:hypothetical protein Glove_346g113 [Diversispora epigaea]|uniref:Uncharacterized protein n=1 Tax=Diversispora epigaea TaxID=1348612 RepID=A0A397HFK1_9GLOM|nr:hypothetical protein Glove_346g113 [Diversispora epigaea]